MLHKMGRLQHLEHCRPQAQISLVCQRSCGVIWEGLIYSCLLHDPDKDLINHINGNIIEHFFSVHALAPTAVEATSFHTFLEPKQVL